MSNVRFQIGIPRAGSAARSAEESDGESQGWTRAGKVALSGSAARAAEEGKRAEALQPKSGKTVALRASGGAVVDADTMMRHSGFASTSTPSESSSLHKPATERDFPESGRISPSRSVSADTVPSSSVEREPEHVSPGTTVHPGLLQGAAARLQSLTRSLFQRRDVGGKL